MVELPPCCYYYAMLRCMHQEDNNKYEHQRSFSHLYNTYVQKEEANYKRT